MDDLYCELYPEIPPEEWQQARENLERYFELALTIANQDPAEAPEGIIDTGSPAATIKERSSANLKI